MHGHEIAMNAVQGAHLRQGDRAIAAERDRHDPGLGEETYRFLDRGEGGLDLSRAHGRITHVDDAERRERIEVGADLVGAK